MLKVDLRGTTLGALVNELGSFWGNADILLCSLKKNRFLRIVDQFSRVA